MGEEANSRQRLGRITPNQWWGGSVHMQGQAPIRQVLIIKKGSADTPLNTQLAYPGVLLSMLSWPSL